jgi:uncharacterized protein (DUF433 family)
MPVEATHPHIQRRFGRSPIIRGTSIKIVNLIAEQRAWGWSPDELCFQYPGVTRDQIRAALDYYGEHAEEMEDEIERRVKKAQKFRKSLRRDDDEYFARLRMHV